MNDDDLFCSIAVQEGFVSQDQLDACRAAGNGTAIRDVLVARGLLTADQVGVIRDIQRIHLAEATPAAESGGVLRQDRHLLACGGCDTYYIVQSLRSGAKFACRKCGTVLTVRPRNDTPVPVPGAPSVRSVGSYDLLEPVGRGAVSVVYRAVDRRTGRTVALKILRQTDIPNPAALRRFQQEARAAGRLSHPNIVPVHEAGESDGTWYIAMDFVPGVTLDRALDGGRLGLREFVEALEAVARAVHLAHQYGIVHRDLKPANIILDASGRPHVTDFGLAKVDHSEKGSTHSGVSLGTPFYMSPEQVEGNTAGTDSRSDIYSLGVMLYEALTGRLPYPGNTVMEVYRGVLSGSLVRPSRLNPEAPPELERVCLKSLERDKARRHSSARDFADDLRRWLDAPGSGEGKTR